MRIIKKKSKLLVELLLAVVVAGFLIGLFSYFTSKEASAAWKDDNWHFRKKLVIDASQVSDADTADFTNFPVLVSIDNDSSLKSNAQSDGDDILFTSSDGTTQLDHEIESYTSDTGTLRAWVEVTTLDYNEDTTIYIYYGNPSSSSQQDATGTWDANYVGVWHLNNGNYNSSTSITNLNGTAYNSPSNLTSAKVAGGLSFSSSTSDNDYIEIANNSNLNSANALTVEAWVNLRSFSSNEMAVGYESSSNQTGYGLWATSGDFRFWVSDGTGFGGTQGTTPGTPTTNTWYHLVGVYNGSTVTAYLNSTAGTPVSYTGGISANTTTPLRFGIRAQDSPGQYNDLDGSIDEVRISNSARSAGWIATEYNNQNSPGTFFKSVGGEEKSKEPVLYWQFDEGQGTSANDSGQARMTGTLNNTPTWQTEDLCVFGKCLWFSGTANMNVSKADDPLLDFGATNNFSVSAWVKRNGTSSAVNYILAKHDITDDTEDGGYKLWMDASGDLCFGIDDDITWDPDVLACTSEVDFDDNQWHYVSGVRDQTGTDTIYLYVDGKQRASASDTTTATLANSNIFYVGVDRDGTSNEWLGFIDEVKVYEYALSSAQVQANFNSKGSVKGVSAQMGGGEMEWLSEGLVGYWKMDESSANGCTGGSNDSCDSSGNGLDGAWGANATSTSGKFGRGVIFDGNNDEVSVGDNDLLDINSTTSKTISLWVKRTGDALYSSPLTLIDKLNQCGDCANDPGYSLRIGTDSLCNPTVSTDELLCFEVGDGTNEYQIRTTGTTLTADSLWHQVTVVFDRLSESNTKIYLDGVAQTDSRTGTLSSIGDASNSGSFCIGDDQQNTCSTQGLYSFNGSLDGVRVYNRALSPKEVRDLYNFAPGPIGYWNFEEGSGTAANDTSGNANNGTLTTGTGGFTPGKYGKGINFDNADTVVNSGSGTTLDNLPASGMTAEAWIYPKGLGENSAGFILAKNVGTTPSSGWILQMAASNAITFTVDGSTDLVRTTSTSAVTSNTWNHVSVSWNGVITTASSVRIYVNGVETSYATTTNGASRVSDATSTFYIGNDSTSAATFNGVIDDIRVYNYARTAKQIVEDMNAGHPAVGSPVGSAVGYWKFDEGQGTNVNDSTPNNNDLTLSSASWTNSGKFGKAFNGATNIRLSRADDADLDFAASDDLSISLWFKSDSATNPSANEYLVEKGATVGSAAIGYAIYTSSSSDGLICFGIDDDAVTNFPEDSVCSSSDIYDNTWHHIVATKTSSRLDLYVDGKANGTPDTAISATGTLENSATFYLADANATDGTDEFLGDLDEVKIYRYALTEDEVKTEYNRGSSLVLGALGSNSSYQSQAANQEYCVPGDTSTCTAPVGEWKFEEKTGTTANDTSGNGNTGTLTSGPTWASGKYGGALNFTAASSQYVDIGTKVNGLPQATSAFTIEAWIYPTDLSSNRIIYGTYSGNGQSIGILTTGALWYCNDGGCASTASSITGAVATNAWQHAVVTYDAASSTTNFRFYVNGKDVSSDTTSNTQATGGSYYAIGRRSGTYFQGKIDEVRIFDYARTPSQIAWDYNKGKPIAHWKMDECTGTSIKDSSGNNYSGTWSGTGGSNTGAGTCTDGLSTSAWYNGATGKRNYSLDFDGTDDAVTVTDTANLRFNNSTDDFSLFAWVKRTTTGTEYIISKEDADNDGYRMLFTSSNTIQCSEDTTDVTSTSTITDTNWHLIGCTIDRDGNGQVYIDGKADGSAVSIGTDAMATTSSITIGTRSYTSTSYFNGQIDDVKVFNYPLTATQVKNEYNYGAVRFGPASGSP